MFDIDTCLAFITGFSSKKINQTFNERLKKKGSTKVQWTALYYLGKHGQLKQTELASLMNTKPSTIVRLIDRMERDGHLVRQRNEHDKRAIFLALTEKGQALLQDLLPEGEIMRDMVNAGITDEEMEIFKKVLDKMADNVSELGQQAFFKNR